MFTENEKRKIFKMFVKNGHLQGRIMFCGDVGYQCPPITKGVEMNESGFDKVTHYLKNYRFKCDNIKRILNYMRQCIKDKEVFDLSLFKHEMNFIDKKQLKQLYKKEELILTAIREKPNIEYCKLFNNIPKFKVTKNCNNYKNGQILYEKIKGVPMETFL